MPSRLQSFVWKKGGASLHACCTSETMLDGGAERPVLGGVISGLVGSSNWAGSIWMRSTAHPAGPTPAAGGALAMGGEDIVPGWHPKQAALRTPAATRM